MASQPKWPSEYSGPKMPLYRLRHRGGRLCDHDVVLRKSSKTPKRCYVDGRGLSSCPGHQRADQPNLSNDPTAGAMRYTLLQYFGTRRKVKVFAPHPASYHAHQTHDSQLARRGRVFNRVLGSRFCQGRHEPLQPSSSSSPRLQGGSASFLQALLAFASSSTLATPTSHYSSTSTSIAYSGSKKNHKLETAPSPPETSRPPRIVTFNTIGDMCARRVAPGLANAKVPTSGLQNRTWRRDL